MYFNTHDFKFYSIPQWEIEGKIFHDHFTGMAVSLKDD